MSRIKGFIKRRILWVGFVAVLVPLGMILAMQYNSLAELERMSVIDYKAALKNDLEAVATEIQYYYRTTAEQRLNIPAIALSDDPESAFCFRANKLNGAKRMFIADFKRDSSRLLFYDPVSNSMEMLPESPETRAVNVACAPWKLLSKEGSPVESRSLVSDERDPENRILLKPILDGSSRVVGVAGMIVDPAYFHERLLPTVSKKYFPKCWTDEGRNGVVLTVRDGADRLVLTSEPVQGNDDEVTVPLQFLFTDYRLGARSRDMTPEQWAHWNFAINLSLLMLMTGVLVGGVFLALRAASREMKLSQMKTDFVSNVSHELRTPLSSIRVFGEFLQLGRVKDPDKITEYGQYIETESGRLTQLINNILDFSKIESSQKNYQFEEADVSEIVASTLKTFEVRMKQDGFSIKYEPPDSPLPKTFIDPDAIAQALLNLLDNAVKYSRSAREIEVKLGLAGQFVTVSVTDHGVGIPRADQEKIFEKFYRVSTGLVHDVKGSGLGLSIVKHIVQAHRGEVTVDSEPGTGSTFTMHLPVVESLAAAGESDRQRPATDSDSALSLGFKPQ